MSRFDTRFAITTSFCIFVVSDNTDGATNATAAKRDVITLRFDVREIIFFGVKKISRFHLLSLFIIYILTEIDLFV